MSVLSPIERVVDAAANGFDLPAWRPTAETTA